MNAAVAEHEEFTTTGIRPGRSPVASADFSYATQTGAPIELRVISQPKPEGKSYAKIDRFENYVYSTRHQSEAYIYHVEVRSPNPVLARYNSPELHDLPPSHVDVAHAIHANRLISLVSTRHILTSQTERLNGYIRLLQLKGDSTLQIQYLKIQYLV